jgi:lipopolysaccharide export system protein LptC
MGRTGRILVTVALVAALLSWWLGRTGDEAAETVREPPSGMRTVEYRIRDFTVVRMTPDGTPAHRLEAPSLRHFRDDDTTEIEQPHLEVFQGQAPPWKIDADRAWMSADGSLMLLTGEVLIDRAGNAGQPPTRVLTRDLRVRPREDYAETDEKVRVETDRDWLEAVGMRAWLRPPSRLKFLSEVEGFYVPQ